MSSHTSKQPWALILGASSGFGEASAVELARAGMNIFGVHMDRRDKLPHVAEVQERIRALGRECEFFNFNAADEDKRKDCVEQIRQRLAADSGTLRVLMHSLAWGALKPLAGAQTVANKKQIESTADIMGHSLVYWVQECLLAGLFDKGARIFAMTSSGSTRAIPEYGPVSAAKAILEAHIRAGLGFVATAQGAPDPATQERSRQLARDAYDTVLRFMQELGLREDDEIELKAGLAALRAALVPGSFPPRT